MIENSFVAHSLATTLRRFIFYGAYPILSIHDFSFLLTAASLGEHSLTLSSLHAAGGV
jgi:hypothetical protein